MLKNKVAIYGANSKNYIEALFGLWRQGAVTVLCPMRDPIETIDEWLNTINCHQVIALDDHLPFKSRHAEVKKWEESVFYPETSSPGTILKTSGSSGQAKSVFHALEQHFASAKAVNESLTVNEKSKWLLCLPLYHVSGLSIVIRCHLAKAKVVVAPEKWNLKWAIEEAGVTHVSLVAAQLKRLMDEEENISLLKVLKAIVVGGGPMPNALLEKASSANLPLVLTYGMTETASQIAQGSMSIAGQILPDRQLKIAYDNEIYVKGPMLFSGYVHGDNVMTATDKKGWFHTGDLGFLDEKNHLHVLGRKDNMFISGGENIHPEEIESALLEHHDIEEAIVIAAPHRNYGECPLAFIKVKVGKNIETKLLKEKLKKQLPGFKIPQLFLPWPCEAPQGAIKTLRGWFKKRQISEML